MLVAIGAAIFADMSNRMNGHEGAVHVVAYVVSGIGFLGAGAIIREEDNVRGLNTAATLRGSATVGACAAADLILESLLATIFVLAANTLLRPVVNRINRQPLDTPAVEATHTVYVIAPRMHQKEALRALEQALDDANYPAHLREIHAFGGNEIEIEMTLTATSVDGDELDQLTQKLAGVDFISEAFWSPSTSE